MLTQKILLKYEKKKENLLPAIKEINEEAGFVSEEAIGKIARYFGLAESEIFSAASFYDHINIKKPAEVVIKICDGANCTVKGAEEVLRQIELFFHQKAGDDFNPKVKIQRESCLGQCLVGPVMIVNETVFERVSPEKVDDILRGYI